MLRRYIWASRRFLQREALKSGPYPDSAAMNKPHENEIAIATFLHAAAGNTEDRRLRRIIVSFVNQMFLENPKLIPALHASPYPHELIPWTLEYAPSTRTHHQPCSP